MRNRDEGWRKRNEEEREEVGGGDEERVGVGVEVS